MTDAPTAQYLAERLIAASRAFQEIDDALATVVSNMAKAGDLPDACRGYKALSDAYDAMDDTRKAIYQRLEGISRATIPEMLSEEGVANITVEVGELKYRFGKTQRMSVSMPDKIGGMEWLRTNGGEGLIQPTVNASSLSSFGKEYTKTTGKDLPMEHFNTSTLVYTSITKAK